MCFWFLSVAALLLCAAQLFAAATPHLASSDEALAWVAEHRSALQAGNELKMFAAILLLSGLIGAGGGRHFNGGAALIAKAAFSLTPVVLVIVVVIEGRLAYPIPGLEPTPTVVVLLASCVYGGLHAVNILLGIGILATGLAARARPRGLVALGASGLVGLLQIVASFNWLVPAAVESLAALTLLTWALAAIYQLSAGDTLP